MIGRYLIQKKNGMMFNFFNGWFSIQFMMIFQTQTNYLFILLFRYI